MLLRCHWKYDRNPIDLTLHTAISREVVGKNVHATILKGNMGYDQYTVPDTSCSCQTCFCCFPLALANIRPWLLVLFFQISLNNSELKTNHNICLQCIFVGIHFDFRVKETVVLLWSQKREN